MEPMRPDPLHPYPRTTAPFHRIGTNRRLLIPLFAMALLLLAACSETAPTLVTPRLPAVYPAPSLEVRYLDREFRPTIGPVRADLLAVERLESTVLALKDKVVEQSNDGNPVFAAPGVPLDEGFLVLFHGPDWPVYIPASALPHLPARRPCLRVHGSVRRSPSATLGSRHPFSPLSGRTDANAGADAFLGTISHGPVRRWPAGRRLASYKSGTSTAGVHGRDLPVYRWRVYQRAGCGHLHCPGCPGGA